MIIEGQRERLQSIQTETHAPKSGPQRQQYYRPPPAPGSIQSHSRKTDIGQLRLSSRQAHLEKFPPFDPFTYNHQMSIFDF